MNQIAPLPTNPFAEYTGNPEEQLPIVVVVRVEPGTGKSREARRKLRRAVLEMALRPVHLPRGRIGVLCPTHVLAQEFLDGLNGFRAPSFLRRRLDEAKARADKKAIKRLTQIIADIENPAMVWSGVDRPDVCKNRDDLKLWTGAGQNQDAFCRRCEFKDDCAYQSQKPDSLIVIFAGSAANDIPARFARGPVVVRDEAGEVVRDADGNALMMKRGPFDELWIDEVEPGQFLSVSSFLVGKLTALRGVPPARTRDNLEGRPGDAARYELAELNMMLDQLVDVAVKIDVGDAKSRPVCLSEIMQGERLGASLGSYRDLARALWGRLIDVDDQRNKLVWKRIGRDGLGPALSLIGVWNSAVRSAIDFCNAAVAALNFHSEHLPDDVDHDTAAVELDHIGIHSTSDGPKLDLMVRARLTQSLARIDTTILDASADKTLLELWWPQVRVIEGPKVLHPHSVEIVQVRDRVGSMSSIIPSKGGDRAEQRLDELSNLIDVYANELEPGELGLTVFKDVAAELERFWKERGHRPDVLVATIGGLRGQNHLRSVVKHIHYGRTCPSFRLVERMAAVLLNVPIERLSETVPARVGRGGNGSTEPVTRGGFDTRDVEVTLKDGSVELFTREYHPDANVEWLRRLLVDESIRQAVHRSRPFTPADERPRELIVGTSIDVGLVPDRSITMKEMFERANPIEATFANVADCDPKDHQALSILTGLDGRRVKYALAKTTTADRLVVAREGSEHRQSYLVYRLEEAEKAVEVPPRDNFPNNVTIGKIVPQGYFYASSPVRRKSFIVRSDLSAEQLQAHLEKMNGGSFEVVRLLPGTPADADHPSVLALAEGFSIAPGTPGRVPALANITGLTPTSVKRRLAKRDPAIDQTCFGLAEQADWHPIQIGKTRLRAADLETATALAVLLDGSSSRPGSPASSKKAAEAPSASDEQIPMKKLNGSPAPFKINPERPLFGTLDGWPTKADVEGVLLGLDVSYQKFESALRKAKKVDKGQSPKAQIVSGAFDLCVAKEYSIDIDAAHDLVRAALRGEPFTLPPKRLKKGE